MLGTIVNTACIIAGSVLGSALKSRLDEKYQNALYGALGLVTLALGANMCVQNFPKSEFPVLFIVSICLGALAGYALDISGRIDRTAERHNVSRLVQGLTTSCLLYCIFVFPVAAIVIKVLRQIEILL